MLTLTLPKVEEVYDEINDQFLELPEVTLEFEHSLVALSSWESKWEVPFLGAEELTEEQTLSYIEEMCLTPNPPEGFVHRLSPDQLQKINDYIARKATATWFKKVPMKPGRTEIITSELVYYWLVAFQIDWQAQYWHLNRLFTLVRVCNEKNNPKKNKRSRADIAADRRTLNAQRKAQFGTPG